MHCGLRVLRAGAVSRMYTSPAAARIVCSTDCAAMLVRNDDAIQLLLRKSQQSARASASTVTSPPDFRAVAAVGAWFMLPSPFLIYFTGGCSLVCLRRGFGISAVQNDNATSLAGIT